MREVDVAAIKNCLMPWVKVALHSGRYEWHRYSVVNKSGIINVQIYTADSISWLVNSSFSGWGYAYFQPTGPTIASHINGITFDTAELAMVACDRELTECGYELISEDRAEKLLLLL